MKKTIALMGLVFFAAGCNPAGKDATPKAPEKISVTEAQGLLVNGFATLVDVREADEIKAGMAAPAQWMPHSKIEANHPDWLAFEQKLPKDKKIVFYCAGGGRSQTVAELLSKKGYQTANMGGYSAWEKAGLPTRKP
jgi:rhodanese-related sulfurtransferase